jgi:TRAP-type C4-dicarboxylate transport system permease large subunit
VNRQPFIVGVDADKILGFLAGFVGSMMGLIATIVVMFLWAGSDPLPDTEARRRHATSVSIWSGIGCALPLLLVFVAIVLMVLVFAGGHSSIEGPMVDPTPFQMYP